MEIRYGIATIKTKTVQSQFGTLRAVAIPELENHGGPKAWEKAFSSEKKAVDYAKQLIDNFEHEYFMCFKEVSK